MPLRVTSPAPRRLWQDLVSADTKALAFQTPQWLDCVCEAGGYEDASRLYETPDGRAMVLPLVARGPARLLRAESSMPPSWGSGGLVAPGDLLAEEVAAVFADLSDRRIVRCRVRPTFLTTDTWDAARPAGVVALRRTVHVLDLQGGFDVVWRERFTDTTRRGLRKAEHDAKRSGLAVECGSSLRFVSAFYDLYLQWITMHAEGSSVPAWLRRWNGRRMDPRRKFETVAAALGSNCRVWLASVGGRPVASLIALVHGPNAIFWRGTDNPALARPHRANELLQRMAIEDACRAGCRYEMGESGGVSSLMRYKERFGAKPYPIAEYRIERLPLTQLESAVDHAQQQVGKRLMRHKNGLAASP